jgi:hypothetical protein
VRAEESGSVLVVCIGNDSSGVIARDKSSGKASV